MNILICFLFVLLHRCILEGLIVDRETVRIILKMLDPEGTDLRKRHRLKRRMYKNPGPNFMWHIDG